MKRFKQKPFLDVDDDDDEFASGVEFADNPEPRCAVVLLLDTSSSMDGEAISELNAGIEAFQKDVLTDTLATKRIEVCIVTFGPVIVQSDFTSVDRLQVDEQVASGRTPTGEAVEKAIQLLKERKSLYRENGISYYRPWIFMITDGAPTDRYEHAIELVRSGEENREFVFFAVGVGGANMAILSKFSTERTALPLNGLEFKKLFTWLSNSLRAVSASTVDDKLSLPNPEGPDGWVKIVQ